VPNSYGEMVRGYRVAAGLTQEELAALSGLGVRTISDIERGRTTRPHRSSAERLSQALGQQDLAQVPVIAYLDPVAEPGVLAPGGPEGTGDGGDRGGRVVPRQLPGWVRHFTGRAGELASLTRLLDTANAGGRGMVVVSAIGGTAGVGKTALAVHWAHQVADQFPDGQLYVNLRGYDPDRPVPPADALAWFLRALGVAGQDIPATMEERAAWFRSLLAGRRVLVVLDNAGYEEQVRSLLPGSSACVTVVTSRDALAGLVARDGATRLDLDLLPPAEAAGLLQALIGPRAEADPAATEALAGQCCRLPLVLRVASELAAARPHDSLASLVAELTDQQRRLDLLDTGGDPRTAVRTVLSWSYQHLEADAARMFRLAGLHPGPDLDAYAAAALTGSTTVDQARRLLARLARGHLIHATGPGRYAMHDLLRAYAAGQAAAQDGQDAARAALTRLFDHYLHTAAAAMDTLVPAEQHRSPRISQPGTPIPPMTDPAAARAWLDGDQAALIAATVHAAEHGWPGHATNLAATLFRYLDTGGHYPEGITVHTCARRVARRIGDRVAEARELNSLGVMNCRQARYPQAARYWRQALDLFRQSGDQAGEAYVLGNLGEVALLQSRYVQATRHLRQAIPLFRQAGDTTGEAYALNSFGEIDARQGRYTQAIRHYQQAQDLFRQTGDRTGEAYTLSNLCDVDLRQGRYPQAICRVRQALDLFRLTRPGR
jgi:tetratricopeptide (TPR) repeat protein/DNA-binding XRE family transcriptional regulator